MRKPYDDESLLCELYVEKDMTQKEIGEQFGVWGQTIGKYLNKYNISKNDIERDWDNPEILYELYIDERLTCKEIGERFGCCYSTIRNRLIEFDIELRSDKEYYEYEPYRQRGILYELYHEKDLTLDEIGNRFDCSGETIRRWCNNLDVPIKIRGVGNQYPQLEDEEFLYEKYTVENFTTREIADIVGCGKTTVRRWMDNHDIPPRDSTFQSGSDHYLWVGGSEKYRGPNWQEQRRKALKRDLYQCQHTGMTNEDHQEEYGCDLHVHHIIPFSHFGKENYQEANRLENLVTLTCSVHRLHEYWSDVVCSLNN